MSHASRHENDDEAEAADRAFGPAIVGLSYRFADPAVEARYKTAMAPSAQRRLNSLVWVALCVSITRLAAPTFGLVHDPSFAYAIPPRLIQVLICGAMIWALKKPRTYDAIEILSCAFVVSYVALRCWLLPRMSNDGSAALVIGSVALLYFGSPLRITILAPLLAAGSGAMLMAWSLSDPAPSRIAALQVLEWLAVVNLLGFYAMRLMRFTLRRQWSLSQALRHLATHDGLTGIANRRHYDQVLAREWRRCRREGRDLSLILMDVDFFKLLNDGVGHAAGDDCLHALATMLTACVDRPDYLVARTGGEEFACVMPGAGGTEARDMAEHIAATLKAQRLPHPGSPIGPHITISLGVATANPADGFTLRDLTGLADRLVYAAKSDGRDCIRQHQLSSDGLKQAAQ